MAKQPQSIQVDASQNETAKYVVYGVVAVGVLALAYFGIIKPILNVVGVTRDKEERQGDRAETKLGRKQVLSPTLYRENRDKVTIGSAKAYNSAKNVYEGEWGGCGGFCDDEDLGVGAITGSGSQVNISYIADAFNTLYGRSMHTFMDGYLEPEDWTAIDNYISKIKKF